MSTWDQFFWQVASAAVAAPVVLVLSGLTGFQFQRLRHRNVREMSHVLTELTEALWSGNPAARLSALVAVQQLIGCRQARDGLADLLVSFIRERLGRRTDTGGNKSGFDDVRLAFGMLTNRRVRRHFERRGYVIDLTNLDFRCVPLRGGDLSMLNLAGSNFDGCDLCRCNLRRSNFRGATLRGAYLVGVDATGVDFTEADLTDTDVSEADLSDANLSNAILTNADLTGTKVDAANLSDTDVAGALLADARGLTQKQLDAAVGDPGTTVPERLKFVPMTKRRRKPALEIVKSDSRTSEEM